MTTKLNLEPYTMEEYTIDPEIFIENLCVINSPFFGVTEFQLWDAQKSILKQIEKNEHIVFEKLNLSGFTTLMCGYVLWYIFSHKEDTVYFVFDGTFTMNKTFELIKLMSTNFKKDLRFGNLSVLHKGNNTLIKFVHKMPKVDGDLLIVDEADNLNSSNDLESAIRLFKKSIMYSNIFWDKEVNTVFRKIAKNARYGGVFKSGFITKEIEPEIVEDEDFIE